MKISAWLVLIYAVLIFVGGAIGYSQANSLASLIMGIFSASLLFVCAIGMFKRSTLAYTLAMAFTLLLTLFFTYRLVATAKFMPAGMMALMSALVLISILSLRKKRAKLS